MGKKGQQESDENGRERRDRSARWPFAQPDGLFVGKFLTCYFYFPDHLGSGAGEEATNQEKIQARNITKQLASTQTPLFLYSHILVEVR